MCSGCTMPSFSDSTARRFRASPAECPRPELNGAQDMRVELLGAAGQDQPKIQNVNDQIGDEPGQVLLGTASRPATAAETAPGAGRTPGTACPLPSGGPCGCPHLDDSNDSPSAPHISRSSHIWSAHSGSAARRRAKAPADSPRLSGMGTERRAQRPGRLSEDTPHNSAMRPSCTRKISIIEGSAACPSSPAGMPWWIVRTAALSASTSMSCTMT